MTQKLTQRMRLILALLKVCGPQSFGNLLQIVYAGQEIFMDRQEQSLRHTLHEMEEMKLIRFLATSKTWDLP